MSETWERMAFVTALLLGQRWVRKCHGVISIHLTHLSILKGEGAWMRSLVIVLCVNFRVNIYQDVSCLHLWKDVGQMGGNGEVCIHRVVSFLGSRVKNDV